ncbi:PAS domain-containing sensor histidine kinase [Pseudomonas putida]|uniref:PAS domain-containing sensor histidine kinase n=1 Tax=Pseudomonas putida TaxID=303 RepID=UPI002363896E|nr:PAS domain-containing sensor histidine kinase [Pseudomonas putida]MDD1963834.1 PAS domain-containing sensor histidine kinase [Pseudomonas putida]
MSLEQLPLPDADALFEDAPCGLIVSREDGTILRANQIFCTWIGRSAAELAGLRFQSLLTMGGRIFHQTHWAPLMQMQGSVAEVKLDLLHRDGHTVTMLLNGVRREHASGAYNELALFSTTDRDAYERELLDARRHAEDLLREKIAAESALQQLQSELSIAYEKSQRRALFAEQMVAIASHDLKNPLTAIKMASEFLARSERSAKDTQLLRHISQSSERAQRMIADLLDLALARVGRGIAITRSSLDLHKVVGQSISELQVTFPQATLEHRSKGAGIAELDADRIEQMIGNLVANGVAYGDPQFPITIVSEVDGGVISLSVHNQGPQIPPSIIEHLFEPMTRGSVKDEDVRSIGLGLFIVREIAVAHGGDVSLTSSADNGTTFLIKIPKIETMSKVLD